MNNRLVILFSAALLFAMSQVPTVASATYTTFDYVGQNFNYASTPPPTSGFFGTDLTDTLTITSGIASNFTGNEALSQITSWSFTSGSQTISSSNGGTMLSSDASGTTFIHFTNGQIDYWNLQVDNSGKTVDFISTYAQPYSGAGFGTGGDWAYQGTKDVSVSYSGTSGAWAPATAAPIPGAAWLFGPGLVSLIGLKRKYVG